MIQFVDTPALRIAYRAGGDPHATPLLLLHGWPDDATTFDAIAPALQQAGWRTFAPWWRGCGSTTFRAASTPRSGETAALAQDVLDFAAALQLQRFAVVGHDWGARVAHLLASVEPQRVSACVALSVPFEPGVPATPPLRQAQAFWYQWFLATERGADVLRRGGKAFARYQWQSWSPPGWFDDVAFDQVARSFENPDWAAVTLHAHRERWGQAEPDPAHAELPRRQRFIPRPATALTARHGDCRRCSRAATAKAPKTHRGSEPPRSPPSQSTRTALRSHSGSQRPRGFHSHTMRCVRPSALKSISARSVAPSKVQRRPSTFTS